MEATADALDQRPPVPLGDVLRNAVECNEQARFGSVKKFEMNPADAERFAAWDVSGALLNGWRGIPVIPNASVPAGWLRTFVAEDSRNFYDAIIPALQEATR